MKAVGIGFITRKAAGAIKRNIFIWNFTL
jgi:hypothetical protein